MYLVRKAGKLLIQGGKLRMSATSPAEECCCDDRVPRTTCLEGVLAQQCYAGTAFTHVSFVFAGWTSSSAYLNGTYILPATSSGVGWRCTWGLVWFPPPSGLQHQLTFAVERSGANVYVNFSFSISGSTILTGTTAAFPAALPLRIDCDPIPPFTSYSFSGPTATATWIAPP